MRFSLLLIILLSMSNFACAKSKSSRGSSTMVANHTRKELPQLEFQVIYTSSTGNLESHLDMVESNLELITGSGMEVIVRDPKIYRQQGLELKKKGRKSIWIFQPESFKNVSDELREQIVLDVFVERYAVKALRLTAASQKNVKKLFGTKVPSFAKPIRQSGPNCYYFTLKFAGLAPDSPQFVSESEFLERLRRAGINPTDQAYAGVAVTFYSNGTLVHAASLIGKDSRGQWILASKNGRQPGNILVMKLEDIEKLYDADRVVLY